MFSVQKNKKTEIKFKTICLEATSKALIPAACSLPGLSTLVTQSFSGSRGLRWTQDFLIQVELGKG